MLDLYGALYISAVLVHMIIVPILLVAVAWFARKEANRHNTVFQVCDLGKVVCSVLSRMRRPSLATCTCASNRTPIIGRLLSSCEKSLPSAR